MGDVRRRLEENTEREPIKKRPKRRNTKGIRRDMKKTEGRSRGVQEKNAGIG